jgi:tripartite ATP-independent transporter DctP family solute receptor
MSNIITRRAFVTGATLGSASLFFDVRAQPRAEFRFVQYHNQTAESSLHKRIAEMWTTIRTETNGRVEAEVFPLNNQVQGSDPQALKMLVAGEIQFFTLMGGVLGNVVPVAEVQQVPFAFRSAEHAHEAVDGALGAFIREEMAAKGIHGFPVGAFDNGMRQMTLVPRPVNVPADLRGIRMRVPSGAMFQDVFQTLGAEPVVTNSIDIYSSLESGKVDAQENPLALLEGFRLYEIVKFVSMTNHMWSGFNQMAHLPTWRRLPADIQQTIERNVARAVRLQRQDQGAANARLRAELETRGLVFNDVDQAPFRTQLSGFYATWKERMGTRCWTLLEQAAGETLA